MTRLYARAAPRKRRPRLIISKARYEDGELRLTSSDKEALQIVFRFKPGDYEIVPKKRKRSLDANAYLWVLLDKLAVAMNMPKLDLYKHEIHDVGGNSDIVCIKEKAADAFERAWQDRGAGWITERTASKLPGCVNIICYYGSSVFDVGTMSRLLNNVVQDCTNCGIETMPQNELEALLGAWNEKSKQ